MTINEEGGRKIESEQGLMFLARVELEMLQLHVMHLSSCKKKCTWSA